MKTALFEGGGGLHVLNEEKPKWRSDSVGSHHFQSQPTAFVRFDAANITRRKSARVGNKSEFFSPNFFLHHFSYNLIKRMQFFLANLEYFGCPKEVLVEPLTRWTEKFMRFIARGEKCCLIFYSSKFSQWIFFIEL